MKPSIRAIIWNDFPALACALGIPIVWVIWVAWPIFKHHDPVAFSFFIPFAAIISLVLGALLFWRVKRVFYLFAHGIEVPGQVTWLHIVRDRGRLEFQFELNGRLVQSWVPVHKSKRVMSFVVGQSVRVLLHPVTFSPVVKDMYL